MGETGKAFKVRIVVEVVVLGLVICVLPLCRGAIRNMAIGMTKPKAHGAGPLRDYYSARREIDALANSEQYDAALKRAEAFCQASSGHKYEARMLARIGELKSLAGAAPADVAAAYMRAVKNADTPELKGAVLRDLWNASKEEQRPEVMAKVKEIFAESLGKDEAATAQAVVIFLSRSDEADALEEVAAQCLETKPESETAVLAFAARAQLLTKRRAYQALVTACQDCIEKHAAHPVSAVALDKLARFCRQHRRMDLLVKTCNKLVGAKTGPELGRVARDILADRCYAQGDYLKAVALYADGPIDPSRTLSADGYVKLLEPFGLDSRWPVKRAPVLEAIGDRLLSEKQFLKAMQFYKRTAQESRKKLVALESGVEEEVILPDDAKKNPKAMEGKCQFWKAFLLYSRGERAAAAPLFESFLEKSPDDAYMPEACYYLANWYLEINDPQRAADHLATAMARLKDNPIFTKLSRRTGVRMKAKQRDTAVMQRYQRTIAAGKSPKEVSEAHLGIARMRMRSRQFGEAEKHLQTIVKSYPKAPASAEALFRLATICLDERHDQAKAKTHLNRLMTSFPDSEYAFKALETIKKMSQPK